MGYGSVPVGVPQQEPSPQELGGRRGGPHRAGPTARRTLATRDQRPRASVGTHGRRAAALAGTAEVRQQGQWVRAAAELPILRSVPGPPWHPPHTEGRRDRQTEVWGQTGKANARRKTGLALSPAHWLPGDGTAPEAGDSHLEPEEQAQTTPGTDALQGQGRHTLSTHPLAARVGNTAWWGRVRGSGSGPSLPPVGMRERPAEPRGVETVCSQFRRRVGGAWKKNWGEAARAGPSGVPPHREGPPRAGARRALPTAAASPAAPPRHSPRAGTAWPWGRAFLGQRGDREPWEGAALRARGHRRARCVRVRVHAARGKRTRMPRATLHPLFRCCSQKPPQTQQKEGGAAEGGRGFALRKEKQNQQKAEQTRGSWRRSPPSRCTWCTGTGGLRTTGRRTSGAGGGGRWQMHSRVHACACGRPARADGPPRSGRAAAAEGGGGRGAGLGAVVRAGVCKYHLNGNCSVTC